MRAKVEYTEGSAEFRFESGNALEWFCSELEYLSELYCLEKETHTNLLFGKGTCNEMSMSGEVTCSKNLLYVIENA